MPPYVSAWDFHLHGNIKHSYSFPYRLFGSGPECRLFECPENSISFLRLWRLLTKILKLLVIKQRRISPCAATRSQKLLRLREADIFVYEYTLQSLMMDLQAQLERSKCKVLGIIFCQGYVFWLDSNWDINSLITPQLLMTCTITYHLIRYLLPSTHESCINL